MSKETIYIDAVTKLNEQDAVIKELAELLSDVLDAWNARDYMSESYDLYVRANDYLKGLRDE
jgi:hypothetical protein